MKNIKLNITFRLLVISFALALPLAGISQDVLRLEFDASKDESYFNVPVGHHGLIIFNPSTEKSEDKDFKTWNIRHYNTAFEEIETKRFLVRESWHFISFRSNDSKLVFLFSKPSGETVYEMVIYDFITQSLKQYTLKSEIHHNLISVAITDDNFFIYGDSKPSRKEYMRSSMVSVCFPLGWFGMEKFTPEMVMVSVDLETGTLKEKKELVEGDLRLVTIQANADKNELLLVNGVNKKREEEKILIMRFSAELDKVSSFEIETNKDYPLINGRLFPVADNTLIFSGTYGLTTKKKNRDSKNNAHGLFYVKLSGESASDIKYYDFNSFQNLSSAIKEKFVKPGLLSSNKDKPKRVDINYQILLHKEVLITDSSITMIGEAFYPYYEYEHRTTYVPYYGGYYYNYYNRYEPDGQWVFKGYRYTHAIIASFDMNGNMLWENSISTSNILSMNLKEKVNLLDYQDETVLVYANNGKLYSKVIFQSETIEDESMYELESLYPNDKVKENFNTNMQKWYDNYFIVWGKQYIKNRSGKNRTVFYITKVAFQ